MCLTSEVSESSLRSDVSIKTIMVSKEQQAQNLMAEAEKKLNSSKGFFGSLFGSTSKSEEVADCYQRAGNLYKMVKKWSEAGDAFSRAANLHTKAGSRHDAAVCHLDAANSYKKSEPKEAVNCYLRAIDIYTDMGRFAIAAKHHQNIAEIYEANDEPQKAVQHFEQSGEYFRGEENHSSANKCFLKVAHHVALLENYEKAVEVYEDVARRSVDNSFLKYCTKEYLFRALLCHLCVDVVNAELALERYVLMCPAFQDSRESKLIQSVLDSLEEQNVDAFTDAVQSYDSVSRFDSWYTTMLLRIKNTLSNRPDLR
ncbi:PREDICTED: alpha-soluble NSF attachment protein-like [Nicrophorus vespilloides]|uniref:Alpha-soluble NSF attachment protein-like n=1 Tax=Nicrophorus vespilloides TaxID=110193 RepID=A0ABM1MJR5_NICVS|nr:PREDICTED: alpha-soluble NSF attachment protein-like [Nicrophorus vespilloides]